MTASRTLRYVKLSTHYKILVCKRIGKHDPTLMPRNPPLLMQYREVLHPKTHKSYQHA